MRCRYAWEWAKAPNPKRRNRKRNRDQGSRRETEKPFHPSEGGGAEHMDPSEYYKAAANKMKVTGNMKPSGLENESSSAVST